MHGPGVEVEPLREMTGDAQFSEVFLTDVHVPDAWRVGDVGDGWRAALGTLANERAGMGEAPLGSAAIDDVLDDLAQRRGTTILFSAIGSPATGCAARSTAWLNMRAQHQRASGIPGPEGSIVKLAAAELGQELYSFGTELLGAEAMLLPGPYPNHRMERGDRLLSGRPFWWLFLRSRGFTIEGGTAQVQRNILAERVLGLPVTSSVAAARPASVPWRTGTSRAEALAGLRRDAQGDDRSRASCVIVTPSVPSCWCIEPAYRPRAPPAWSGHMWCSTQSSARIGVRNHIA